MMEISLSSTVLVGWGKGKWGGEKEGGTGNTRGRRKRRKITIGEKGKGR